MGLSPIARLLKALLFVPGSLAAASEGALSLKVLGSSSYRPGTPVFLRLEVRESDGSVARGLWDAEAALTAESGGSPAVLSQDRVTLRNGMGSALVTIGSVPASQDVLIAASIGSLQGSRSLRNIGGLAPTSVQGSLTAPLTEWSGLVRVIGAVTVPAGKILRVLPGTLVLVDGIPVSAAGLSIVVRGTLECTGTEEEPVAFTATNPDVPWGEIHHDGAAPSTYTHTILTRGGNSPGAGHTGTGPIVRSTNSKIVFRSSSLTDTSGKTMEASGSDLEFHDCLIARSVMGPEIGVTALLLERSYVMEMRGADDNDGIYLHSQGAGQVIAIRGSVFADCDDDGIDTLGSTVSLEESIVRDCHGLDPDAKGISIQMGDVRVERCLLVDNLVGISAKGSGSIGATVSIARTTIIGTDRPSPSGPQVGIQAEDKHGLPDLRILISATSSIVRAPIAVNSDYAVRFPDDLRISYSDLSSLWPGAFNVFNITDDPSFADPAANDYRLQASSPCIDAGDPALPQDLDGTRADMGALPFTHGEGPPFQRGLVNEDGDLDLSDATALLFHLFASRPLPCRKAADADDGGTLDVTDVVLLLGYLFLDDPSLAPPVGSCGIDPQPDDLDCLAPVCP